MLPCWMSVLDISRQVLWLSQLRQGLWELRRCAGLKDHVGPIGYGQDFGCSVKPRGDDQE